MHIFKQSVSGLHSDDPNDPNNNASGYTGTGFNPGFNTSVMPPATPPVQPLQPPQDGTAAQLADLQRQVEELQRQSASGSAGQQNQPL
jgi:hypothetical protein